MAVIYSSRRVAYLGALKYYFHGALIEGKGRRAAWAGAKKLAADYAFSVPTRNLNISVGVW